jgi:hypothetical protein
VIRLKRYRLQTLRRRRLIVLGILTLVAWTALFAVQRQSRTGVPATTTTQAAADMQVQAYLVATGVLALPPPGQGPADYQAAAASAAAAGAPLGTLVWVDREAFETRGWRDLIQVGRVPINRPPAIDFVREVAVLTWAIPDQAPPPVLAAPGLILRRTALQHVAVELGVTPQPSGRVAAPNAAGTVVPYALMTVPRLQWPIPAPPPTVPPVVVTLTR